EGSIRPTDFEDFFRSERPRLLPVAVALTGSREVAHDLVQDAMLRTFRAWSTVAGLDRPGAWTRRVLINMCIDSHRGSERERRALARTPPPGTTDMPDPQTAALWAKVRALPPRQRAAVALHYIDDMSVVDVASTLKVSVGTVKTSLSRARATLARALTAEES
ncbi:MAG: SigE family RNA polymerase sigma factor, partial [Ilumatobacteraceae bacterium]